MQTMLSGVEADAHNSNENNGGSNTDTVAPRCSYLNIPGWGRAGIVASSVLTFDFFSFTERNEIRPIKP